MKQILRHKVAGFTVMELLVTMVISGIVVLSAFEFYIIFNKLILKKNSDMEGGKEVLLFYDLLRNDTEGSVMLNSTGDGISFRMDENHIIHYEFFKDFVVRLNNNLPDTFNVRVLDFNTEKDLTTGYIKFITLEIQKNKESFPVILEKNYPNDILLNRAIFPDK